jgi:hypothetical protein
MNHTVYSGLLEIVTEMLLIRPDIDDELIAKNGTLLPETEDKDETVSMSQMAQFSNLIVRGPINCVETFDGFVRSAIDQIRSGKYYKNYLDMSNLQVTSNFTLKGASYNAESVN